MADDQVVTNIVARADFSDLIANVRKVTTSLAAMQQQIGSSNKVLSAQINAVNRSFGETLRSTGQFSTHFVSLANDVDTFGKRLDGGKLKLRDYFSTLQTHTRTSGGLIRDLARQQVQLQNAILQPLGRNAQGLMQFNVHVPQGLDQIKNKGAIARQEMQILNKVMQEGSVGLINWGKNTQWAGRQLTVGLTVPIVAFGAAAAKAFREADQELTRLTKVYGGLAATSSSELQKVRRDVTAVADELARGYGSSFKETLALSADIAATGKQGSELLGSIRETTRLAVLGEVDRQDAMKATLAIQSAFRQDTDELAKSINFLNAVENQTSTSLSDLVEAIPKAGPIIKGLGGNIQDLALYLTAMKEGGINASEGANAIKSALASLINPTDVAVKKFEGFGIDLMGIVNNNAGDVTKTLFALQGALNKLDPLQKSQAIEQLFGKFQFARLSALFENLGAQGSQTLKVMDLMKASSKDLASIAGRELSMVTESASGKYRRAVEGLKADLAGVGEEFLKVSTFFINLVDGIIQFVNKLPAPVKTILTFLAGLTAVTGPLIMLTGVLANFLGYVIKGAFHLKALFKGGEGWRMLTPEILAAQKAGSLIEKTFYSDAKAALALAEALQVLSAGMTSIQSKMTQGVVSVQPMLSTVAGSIIKPPGDDGGGGGGGGIARIVDPRNPLVGPAGTRASAHMVPRSGMTPEQRAAQTIHSFLPAPIPVNQAVGANPQIFASGDLPSVPGLTTILGKSGPVSTGVVSSEAAKWHAMIGTLSMMTKTEVAQMKTQIRTTGTVTSEFTQAFGSLLPQMTSISENAARQSAIIVAEAKAGTISVQTARQRIIALNIQVEQLMAQATMGTATSLGRTAVLTGVPTLDQPVVDPKTGKSNMRELFKKGKTRSFVDDLARLMGVRTWGAGYSTHTTIPIRRNMGGKVYNPEVHGNVVPGDTSIDYDNTPAVLREGGFILNQSSSRVNPDLVNLAKNSKNAGGKIVPAILTPGETYFPPEIAQEIMPTLEKANSGSVIKLLNSGGMLGGRVSSKKLNYGVMVSPIDILSKLGRWNPSMARGARRIYDTRSSGSRASNSPRTFDPGSQFGPETYHSLFRRSSGTWGVHGGALRHGERDADEVLGHVITSKFLKQFKGLPEQGSSRVLTGSQLESRFGLMPGGATASKKYQVLPDNLITITKDFNAALLNGSATGAMWLSSQRQPQHFISLLSHLLNSGVPYKVAYRVAGKTLARINKAMYRLKDTSLTETKWGNIVDSSMQAEISALSRSYTKGSMHSFNAGGIVPGGMVSGNRLNYGIPALAASAIARLTSRWKTPSPYSPATQKHDWTNTDPLHGPLFIGRANIGSEGVRRSLSYNLALPDGRRQLVGISPMMSNDPRYLIERYMAGDKAVLARMQYEGRKGLNPHPLSIQSLFRLLARPFRGTLYRGMTSQSVSDTLPKHIVEAIERARATGDFSQLIGRAFIMRRASFTADPRMAQFFAPGSGGLVLQASLSGRRVTPTSEMFPDKKFQAPYGQDWSGGISSRRYRSEQESLVGGRFIITGFDGKKLIVEGRAMGGPVSGATPYMVGERGPELFVPKNSGGIIPNYALGGVVKGGKINYGELPPGWAQSLAQPTLADQMRASGELPSRSVSVPEATQRSGGRGLLMGAARMGGSIGGWQLGSMLGSSLTGGNQFGSILGGFAGGAAADAAIIKLTNHLSEAGKAAGGAATKTSLLSKAFQFFIKLPGPVKLLAVVVGVGLAIKTMNDKIEEHRRIVSSGFGISEESAKKLGLQYKKLGFEIDSYQQKYDLMLAKAAANRYSQTKAEGKGIDITVPELEKLKKEVAKNFPDEIKMFDKVTNKEAIERAANLKAGMVAAGKSVEEANEIILAMIMNSNKSAYALEILSDRGFGKIQGKVSATNATVKTFSKVIKEGNFDQLPIALQTAVNALDNLQQSFIKIDDKTKKALTSSEAYEKVLGQISKTANQAIGEKGLEEILAQNEGLRDVISSTDTLAGIWAKIKLSVSGITFNLKDMSTETATAISLLLEQQKNYLSSNDSLISSAADLIAKTGNITANQLIKNANRTKESIQKEIELRQKNIQRIKDEADAKKKALEQETEAEDFLLQIQKKQIEYSEALASGDMATAAQAQLDIQSMTGARQLDLAKTAIDSKAEKDIKKQQDLINNLTDALDGLSKSLEKQIAAAGSQQAKKADMQGLYDLFFQAVTLGMGGVTADEKLIIADIAKQLSNSGIEEFVNLSNKYLQMSPTGPYVGRAQAMGFGSLESLGASSFSVVAGKLQVEDTELSKYIKALATGQTGDSTTNFTPKLTTEKSAMGPKATYTITPQQYVDSGMYVQGENPVKEKKTFIDYAGRRFKVVGVQEDGDYIVERVFAAGGMIKNFMPGGNVTGPGTSTSDSIPAMLSDGEYVIRASSVKKYGTETFEKLNAGKFANGGPVNTSALITPSIPYYMKNGGMIPGYFDGGSVFNRILNSAISPLGAAGFGLDVLSKIDSYRKNKDIGKFVKISGDGREWMRKATVNPERESIYVYDMATRYDAKDRGPIVDGALKYLTGQTGVQFKRATFGMRNNPEVVKLNWNTLYKEENPEIAGNAVAGSRYVNLRSPSYLNLGTTGRLGGIQTTSHEILHSLGIGEYEQNYGGPYDDSMFFGHAKNPFNVMFPFSIPGLNPSKFVSKGDTEQLRYLTDFYNFESKDIPIGKAMGGMVPGYHKGGPAGHKHSSRQQLPFFPWSPNLPNYLNGKPTGDPWTGRWGELRYNPSEGTDIWGGKEPGYNFTGTIKDKSDYWHQMYEQPNKPTGSGMAIDKDPMRYAGSGASMGGMGMGAYGLGPLMLAGGGSAIKTALGWITKNLTKIKLPSISVAKNTGRTVEPENIETFLSSVLGDVKLPEIKTAALPPNHAGQYIPRFGDEPGTNLLPYILFQSKIKTSGNTAVHETMHHFDVDVLHDSFKKMLARLRESGKTDLADEYESIFVTGENKQKGFGYESWAQKALDLRDHDSIAYFGGTAEAFAEESTFKAYQKFITSKNPKDKKLALTIGNPYGPGFSTDILRGYFKSYKEYQRNALASPIRLNPLFLKGLVENSPNMPEKTKNIYSMWAEGLEKFRPPARKNQDEILNSLQFQQFKQYIIDNNLDRAKGYSQGGYINPSSLISSSVPHYMNMGGKIPGYHDGGPIGHKHPSTSYSPTPMSASAKEIMSLRTKLIKSGYANSQYLPRLVEPTSGVSPFNIPSSVGSTASLFSPATGIAGDPKFIADSQEATSFSRQLGDMFNFVLKPFTPSEAPDVNKQTEKSKYMREQMAIAWDMMHKVNPAFKLGSWLVKPMFDAATNIGAGNGKWNDYTTIASSFIGSGLYKNAAKGAFGGIKALSSKAPAFLKNFGSSAAGKLVPVPKTTVHAQMPGPKKLSEDTLKSIKEMEDQLAKTIQEIDDLRSGAYYEKHTWANPAYKDSSIEHLEAAVARYTENIARAKATDVPPGFFGALDLFIQKPMYAQGDDFSTIASATSRSSAFTTMPFYRALSMKDMAEITGWSTRPNIADMTLGLPWMKQHGKSLLEETPWGSLYGSRWRPGVAEEIPPGATRHPDVPAHVPDSALYGGLPGRLSPESWQFLEKDPALKIGESWIPQMHKSITDSLDFAKHVAINSGTGGGGTSAIARFEFTPESKGILDLRGIAQGAGWNLDPNAGEGLIAPWTEYLLKAINKNKYSYSVPGRVGEESTVTKLIDEYVFTVLGQHIPPGWTPFYKAMGGLVSQHDIPKFEKGINMVPANMLAMLHKNEAVVPANMNPFNPNAQSYSQPSISYNIAPVINAAPGMDEQAIANMATRQVLAEIKVIDARNNASMGRPGTRVVGK